MAPAWEAQKERILELYSNPNHTLKSVMEIMSQSDFHASMSGYERQLRRWGFRKNRNRRDMTSLKIKLEQRKRQGKDSSVYYGGKLLSQLEVQERTAKLYVPYGAALAVQECATPPGMTVTTPTSEAPQRRLTITISSDYTTSSDYMLSMRTKDLPFKYFLKQLGPLKSLTMLIDMPTEILTTIIAAIRPNRRAGSSPIGTLYHYLSATLPGGTDNHVVPVLRRIVCLGSDFSAATIEILKVVVYLLSNKLLDDSCLVPDELLKWFQMGHNYLFLEAILARKIPTIEAFGERIFSSAIKAADRTIVNVFLRSGVDPDIAVPEPSRSDGICTPLQLATAANNLPMVELLLEYNSDIRLIIEKEYVSCGALAPLSLASQNGNIDLVKLLISRGAAPNQINDSVGTSPLQEAALMGNVEAARVLLAAGADVNIETGLTGSPLECAIYAKSSRLVDIFLEHGANVNGQENSVNTPLQSAAMVDDHETVHRLLQRGADANASAPIRKILETKFNTVRGYYTQTALQWAAKNGNIQMCQELLDAGAKLNAAPGIESASLISVEKWRGQPVLAAAVSSRNYQLVEWLMEYGADINENRGEETALEVAMRLVDIPLVELLLSKQPQLGMSLGLAVNSGQVPLIQALLTAGADVNGVDRNGESALSMAVGTRNCSLLLLLLDAGADPNLSLTGSANIANPLLEATRVNNLEMIKMLVAKGADLHAYSNIRDLSANLSRIGTRTRNLNALQQAALNGNLDVVRYFVEAGADVNFPAGGKLHGRTALQAAAESGNYKLINYLIQKGADVNAPAGISDGRTAVQAAVEFGNYELVDYLIEKGANINRPAGEEYGATALQAAVSRNNLQLVQALLSAGAIANDAPSKIGGLTSLQRAAKQGNDQLVQLLIDHGADVNSPAADAWGFTAIQAACAGGHSSTVELLLARGADANAPPSQIYGHIALELAVRHGYLHIADIMLKHGANVNAPACGNYTYTALEYAAERGHIDMLKLLLNAGADITSDFGRAQFEEAHSLALSGGHRAAAKLLQHHQTPE